MQYILTATASPLTGNVGATVYIIIGAVAAAVIIGTIIAGIVGKKNKK